MSSEAQATFLFADIAGFTALTEAHGDEHAVQLVEEFANVVQAELPRVDGEYVKAVGDALMLRVPEPGDAVRFGLWITRNAMSGHHAPSVRVGGNHGSAVERSGDYFGTTINVAARVSALAAGGEVLITGRTAALAPDLEGVLYESRGRQVLAQCCGAGRNLRRRSRGRECRSLGDRPCLSDGGRSRACSWALAAG